MDSRGQTLGSGAATSELSDPVRIEESVAIRPAALITTVAASGITSGKAIKHVSDCSYAYQLPPLRKHVAHDKKWIATPGSHPVRHTLIPTTGEFSVRYRQLQTLGYNVRFRMPAYQHTSAPDVTDVRLPCFAGAVIFISYPDIS